MTARLQLAPLDRRNPAQLAGLWTVWRAAYGQEAELLGLAPADFPPLQYSAERLRDAPAPCMLALAAGQVLGAVVYQPGVSGATMGERAPGVLASDAPTLDVPALDVQALVVAPAWQRRGIASALLIGLMQAHPQVAMQVSTARANAPALALYQRLGFALSAEWTLDQGLVLVTLTRPPWALQAC